MFSWERKLLKFVELGHLGMFGTNLVSTYVWLVSLAFTIIVFLYFTLSTHAQGRFQYFVCVGTHSPLLYCVEGLSSKLRVIEYLKKVQMYINSSVQKQSKGSQPLYEYQHLFYAPPLHLLNHCHYYVLTCFMFLREENN